LSGLGAGAGMARPFDWPPAPSRPATRPGGLAAPAAAVRALARVG
jgi:hypothetical protein